MTPWSKLYVALWGLWCVLAAVVAVAGPPTLGPVHRDLWWILVGAFIVLETVGGLARIDRKPMLTEVFGRYVPGFVLFPVLALAAWRLSHWVPGYILYPGTAWQLWHFVATYHAFQKLGGK